jgi:hypothetical protein
MRSLKTSFSQRSCNQMPVWSLWNGFSMGVERFLVAAVGLGVEDEGVGLGTEKSVLLQSFLCCFQWVFWQVRLQYHSSRHLAQRLRFVVVGQLAHFGGETEEVMMDLRGLRSGMLVGERWAPYMWVGKRRMCLRLHLHLRLYLPFDCPYYMQDKRQQH